MKNVFVTLFLFLFFSGQSQVTVHNETFTGGIGTWSSVNILDATNVWTATSNFMQMNGLGGTADEDWLISPSINMNAQVKEYFMFDYRDNNTGNLIELYYSTNYSGVANSANVSAATWTSIPLKVLDISTITCFTTLFQRHPAIDISSINGTNVYFAFKYTGTATVAKQYQIDNVRIEANYYGSLNEELTCASLKTALFNIIKTQPKVLTYTSTVYDVWDAFLHTDTRKNDLNSAVIVWDMFTDFPLTTGEFENNHCTHRDNGTCSGTEGACYNREHTLPKSWWGGGVTLSSVQHTDMHHIFPSDKGLNSAKNNYPPGNVITPVTTGSNGVKVGINNTYPCGTSMRYFEPINAYKGDYARTFLFMITRYENLIAGWKTIVPEGNCALGSTAYPGYEPWLIQTLLEWHASDPLSQKEIDRNNAVYAIQGNRNPFIDNPTWVTKIWGNQFGVPCDFTPLAAELVDFNVTLINTQAILHWQTKTELNSDYFEIERSTNGIHWTKISDTPAAGQSDELLSYQAIDFSPVSGTSYYRLKEIDLNGTERYSEIRILHNEDNLILSLYPNPANEVLNINGKNLDMESIRIVNVLGNDLTNSVFVERSSSDQLIISLINLPSDFYFISDGVKFYKFVKE